MNEKRKRPPETGTPIMVRMQAKQLRWLDGERAMQNSNLTRPEAVRMIIEEKQNSMSEYEQFIREFHGHKINIDGNYSDPKFESPAQFNGPVEAIEWIKNNNLTDQVRRFEIQMSDDEKDIMPVTHEIIQNLVKSMPNK